MGEAEEQQQQTTPLQAASAVSADGGFSLTNWYVTNQDEKDATPASTFIVAAGD